MPDVVFKDQSGTRRPDVKYVDMGDGTFAEAVYIAGGGGGGGGAGSDREFVVTTYRAKNAFSGASVGDVITCTQVIDVTNAPTTVGVIWRNQTTTTDLGSAPSAANLELVGSDALTNAQLRAAPVAVESPALTNLDVDVGATSDAAASSDTGSFSLISLVKRALQNWTTLLARVPATVFGTPSQDQGGLPSRLVGQTVANAGFSAVGASVLDAFFVQTPIVGSGVTYNQAAGALNVVSGTATNAEFLARSTASYRGSMRLRFSLTASQRVANSNFAVLLADLIGEGLSYTINSATSVTVNVPGHTLDATNVGQFVLLGGITGAAGVPGRYAIASVVAGTSITFTVAGWPASGSGTLTLFGRNYIRQLATGATATTLNVDAQRNGWATGDTAATINTTAAPGTVVQVEATGREIFWADSLRATSTTPNFTTRASRYENIPDQTTDLFVFLWSFNGTAAPTTTTYTLAHLSVESFANLPVYLQGVRSLGQQNALPVQLQPGANNIGSVNIAANQNLNAINSLASVTSANLGIPGTVADVASAAITTSATVAAITPTFGTSYVVNIPVTAVTGTNPTLDVSVEESDDGGTNWFKVYDFPRIVATGMYRSPKLPLTGNRVRYVQTVGGSGPSFTRAVNRLQSSDDVAAIRQLVDRTVVLTTLNSVTPTLNVQNCRNLQLAINIGAATTPPSLQLQGSDDGGLSWYNIGTALAAVASSTVQVTVSNVNAQLARAQVSSAGATVAAGYVLIKGF